MGQDRRCAGKGIALNIIEPMAITDGILNASNVPETDHTAWSGATAYVAEDRVILVSTHSIYECIAGHTNKNPATAPDAATYWIRVSATNRWKAFDGMVQDQVSVAGDMEYTFEPTVLVDRVAFFGLDAGSIEIVVKDNGAATVHTETIDLVDRTESVTWFSWFYDPIIYDTEALSAALPGYVGNTIEVTIVNPSTAKVGEIIVGRGQSLGDTLVGTTVGFKDYSTVERDDFGNASIVERAYTDTVEYQFSYPTENTRLVKRIIARNRITPCVYFSGDAETYFGTLVFGIHQGLQTPLTTTLTFATLEVEGMS